MNGYMYRCLNTVMSNMYTYVHWYSVIWEESDDHRVGPVEKDNVWSGKHVVVNEDYD